MPLDIYSANRCQGMENLGDAAPQQFPRLRDLVFIQRLPAVFEILAGVLQMPAGFGSGVW
jgi:hypothetical protein